MPPGSAMVFVGPNTLYPRANCLRTQIGLAFTRIARPRECHDLERGTNMQNSTDAVSRDKLIADFKVVVADAEELLKLTAGQAGEKLTDVRARLNDRLAVAKDRIADADLAVRQQTKKVVDVTDDYVHKNPWQSVGVAAGVAFLLGLLVSRR
jgi:ElaB/YqjD/DUF883 family membrane-anchored ribosome-binding protein